MAKVVEEIVIIKLSKLVKDSASDTLDVPAGFQESLAEVISTLSDEYSIVAEVMEQD